MKTRIAVTMLATLLGVGLAAAPAHAALVPQEIPMPGINELDDVCVNSERRSVCVPFGVLYVPDYVEDMVGA